MAYEPENMQISMIILFTVITLYFIGLCIYISSFRDSQAVYARSYFLIIFSAVFGYLEAVLSIIYGYFAIKGMEHFSQSMLIIYFLLVTLNDLFFLTLLLKIYRVFNLIKLSSGYFASKNAHSLKSRLKLSWNIKVLIITTSALVLPVLCIIITSISIQLDESQFDSISSKHVIVQLSLECLTMILLNIYINRRNCDISLKIEYTLYVIGWIGCYIIMFIESNLVFLLVLPIRNTIILTINTVSIYEHDKHFIIPLPDIFDLDFALKSKFFVEKIKDQLKKNPTPKFQLQFEVLFNICVYEKTKSHQEKEKILNLLKDLKSQMKFPPSLNLSSDSDFELIFSEIYSEFDNDFFQDFLKSNEFNELTIDYSAG
jgi:hypothetical protein